MGQSHYLTYGHLITAALAISLLPIIPLPTGTGDEPAAFSSELARQHIGELARTPYAMGSEEIEQTRQMIIDELPQLGLQPER